MKTAVVVIQRGGSLDGCEKDIGEAIAVDIADGDASADEQVAIGEGVFVVDVVAMGEPRARAIHLGESHGTASGNAESTPAISGFVMPGDVDRFVAQIGR